MYLKTKNLAKNRIRIRSIFVVYVWEWALDKQL